MLERLQSIPGVRSVAAINVLPLNGFSNLPTEREGHPENGIGGMEVRTVTPAYFEIMSIPVRRGRAFAASDTGAAPPVILVNETLARRWWPGANAIGDRVVIGRLQGRDIGEFLNPAREVVGIVADTKTGDVRESASPTVYIPAAQASDGMARFAGSVSWVVRGAVSAGLAEELRRAVTEMDSRQRIGAIRPMEELVAATRADSRFDAWLFGFFSGVALLLTAAGVYGLLAYSVARRTAEIGTRMALGATRGSVLILILRQGLGLVAAGLAIGLAGSLAVTRFLQTLLFGVRPTDPASYVAVAVLLLGAGLLASYLPARRATKVDPMTALRCE
jgi:predicted permease